MRALTVGTFGGPDALEIVDLPLPEPGDDEVRIRVAAAPAQPVDVGTRAGHYADVPARRSTATRSGGTSPARSTPSAPRSAASPSVTP